MIHIKHAAAILLLTGFSLSANAQIVSSLTKTDVNPQHTEQQESANEEDNHKGWQKKASSFSFNYMGRFEKVAIVNYDMRLYMFNVGGSYTVSGDIDGWNIYIGAAQRYYVNRNFYIDAAVGPIYSHSSFEYRVYDGQETYYIFNKPYTRDRYRTEKVSSGGVGLYLLPRIGLITNKGWGINIGYMMSAPKFKFDGFFNNGSIMLGIVFGA